MRITLRRLKSVGEFGHVSIEVEKTVVFGLGSAVQTLADDIDRYVRLWSERGQRENKIAELKSQLEYDYTQEHKDDLRAEIAKLEVDNAWCNGEPW